MINKSLIALGVLIVGYVAYYLISPIFTEIHLDEEAPVEEFTKAEVLDVKVTNEDTNSVTTESVAVANTEVSDDVLSKGSKFASVIGTSGHPGSGEARIINTADGDVLRYENFKTINGPDLFVYLAKDLEATEFVNLGELKATEGNVNYSIPTGTDVSDYPYALVWCKQFGVLFNSADLSAIGL